MTEAPDFMTEPPNFAAPLTGPEGTDVLSDILRRFRVTGAALLRGEYSAPWGWDAPSADEIAAHLHTPDTRLVIFHIVAHGRCWLEVAGQPRIELSAGDLVGFPQGHSHRMGWGSGAAPFPIIDMFPTPPWKSVPTIRRVERGQVCRILCVYLRCEAPLFDPLTSALPNLIVMRAGGGASGFTDAIVRGLIEEASAMRAGSASFTARLTELLFVQIIRDHLRRSDPNGRGMLAALKDRFVGKALQAFHAEPAYPWTMPELSCRAGLSQSALRERFARVLGVSPMRYLALWRLQLAALLLRQNDASVADIAAEVGYDAPEAFARAFKRAIGTTPARWRNRVPVIE
ncbi:MAG: AraC family transcriptional regulator [Rhizobiaceae bacterium]|nr:AraC family transcriptional regulator [Rhizobiaceae bacterium]